MSPRIAVVQVGMADAEAPVAGRFVRQTGPLSGPFCPTFQWTRSAPGPIERHRLAPAAPSLLLVGESRAMAQDSPTRTGGAA